MSQQPRQETASVPLYDQRQQPQPSYKQRDADGGFGTPLEDKVLVTINCGRDGRGESYCFCGNMRVLNFRSLATALHIILICK